MEITWRYSQRTVWTATLEAEVLGSVEEQYCSYVAINPVTGSFNTYRTLSEAMEAFEAPQ